MFIRHIKMSRRKLPYYLLRLNSASSHCRGCGQILTHKEERILFSLCEECFEKFPAIKMKNLNCAKIRSKKTRSKLKPLTKEEIELELYGRIVTKQRYGFYMKF